MFGFPFHAVNRHRRRELLSRRWWSPGAISWGADLSGVAPTILNANADAVCPTAVWTTAILSQTGGVGVPIAQRTNNDFYAYIAGALVLTSTAQTLTALQISYALVSGTPLSVYVAPFAALNVATPVILPLFLTGPLSQNAYRAPGAIPLIEVMPTGDTVTVAALGSRAIFQLLTGVE